MTSGPEGSWWGSERFSELSKFLYCRLENSTGQLTVYPLNTMFSLLVVRRTGHAG